MSARYDYTPRRTPSKAEPAKPQPKRRVLWSISDERGRRIADGLTPTPMDDREALSWVMRGGPHDGTPPTIEPDCVYRFAAGQCAATARGDELERVDQAGTLDEVRLVAERELSGQSSAHLFPAHARNFAGALSEALDVDEIPLPVVRPVFGPCATPAARKSALDDALKCLRVGLFDAALANGLLAAAGRVMPRIAGSVLVWDLGGFVCKIHETAALDQAHVSLEGWLRASRIIP